MGKRPPPAKPTRGADFAITNVQKTQQDIYEAVNLARTLPDNPLIRSVKETLLLAHSAIDNADVPAKYVFYNGYKKATLKYCREGIRNAFEKVGGTLEVLSQRNSLYPYKMVFRVKKPTPKQTAIMINPVGTQVAGNFYLGVKY